MLISLTNRLVNNMRQLLSSHGCMVVYRHISKHWVLVHFLEIIGVHGSSWYLPYQCQNWHIIILCVIQPIQKMNSTRTGRTKRRPDSTRYLSFTCSSQCAYFFMANLNIINGVTAIVQRIHGTIKRTAR